MCFGWFLLHLNLKLMKPLQDPTEGLMLMVLGTCLVIITGFFTYLSLHMRKKTEVTGLKIELLGETSIASTISYLYNAFVYVGSSYGDSQGKKRFVAGKKKRNTEKAVPPEKFRTICSSIDKLDKQSFEQIKKEMVEEKGLNVETADKIGTFVKQRGRPLELLFELKQAGSKFLENSESLQALNELEILFRALEKSKCISKVVLDLSLARGLDYYTGVIYEAVFKGATQVGSIAAGGRYDKLIGMFGTKQVPAVGVSLGIERVFTIMEQLQRDQNQAVRATETQILVSILGDDLSLAAELVSECWAAKLKAEYLLNKRVMKHIDRAKDSRIPWMVIVGERELNEGIVKLKDVAANKEEEVPRSKFVEELHRRLSSFSP